MNPVIKEVSNALLERLGIKPRKYQVKVFRDLIELISRGERLIVVSMPTGSGKTIIELLSTLYLIRSGVPKVLVLEPTRFLCDQMFAEGKGLWGRLFGDLVSREYEGNCKSFITDKRVVISTPQTALKCLSTVSRGFNALVIDEVHHAFGNRYYSELIQGLTPDLIIGFTALLPRYRRYRLSQEIIKSLGKPRLLMYDFRKLREIDPTFEPPKAVADLFDAEFSDKEELVYNKLFRWSSADYSGIIKFLERTLARHGKEAFCESYLRAVDRGSLPRVSGFEELCSSDEPSHKARALLNILITYDVKESKALKPVIIFTSRKRTAYEFTRVITKEGGLGIPSEDVITLTSDVSKDGRLELVRKARRGEVDVIVSTLVGEEGVDIPEAGLLIMTDVPKNPLRFYQRIGRLIRMTGKYRIKYLAITLTPKTIEYSDLEDALWRLYYEGVDISYIIINLPSKSLSRRVTDLIKEFTKLYEGASVPYTALAFGRKISNPLGYVVNVIKGNSKCSELLIKGIKNLGLKPELLGDIEDIIYYVLTFHMLRNKDVRKALEPINNAVRKSRLYKELTSLIREGKVLYIYDADSMAELLNYKLLSTYKSCVSRDICSTLARLDIKSFLALFARAFLRSELDNVLNALRNELNKSRKFLDELSKSGIISNYLVFVREGDYSERGFLLPLMLNVSVKLNNVYVRVETQVNYYDISSEAVRNDKIFELLRTNLELIGYKLVSNFIDRVVITRSLSPEG